VAACDRPSRKTLSYRITDVDLFPDTKRLHLPTCRQLKIEFILTTCEHGKPRVPRPGARTPMDTLEPRLMSFEECAAAHLEEIEACPNQPDNIMFVNGYGGAELE
jgi:hypothetical protein